MSEQARKVWHREPAALVVVVGALLTLLVEVGVELSSTASVAVNTIVWVVAGGVIRHEVSPVALLPPPVAGHVRNE